MLRTIGERHVDAVYVAPGATIGASSWRILGDVLAARGIRLCLIAPPPDAGAETLTVRRLAYATLSREHKTLTAWAVVDGRTPVSPAGRAIGLQVRARTTLPVSVTIEADDQQSRLVPLCFGACPKESTLQVYEHARRGLDAGALLSATQGGAATPIIDGAALRRRPLLHFETAAANAEPG